MKTKILKIVLSLILLYWLYALYSAHIVYYSGYVYEDNRPLSNVKVIERDKGNHTYTDEKGYFKFRKKECVNDYLIFIKENYKTDTIFLTPIGGRYHKIEYLFLRKRKDSIILKKIKE